MTPRPRVLLTGATGFVGGHLLEALPAAGWEVRAASRNPERARASAPQHDWVELDLHRPESLRPALTGCRAAIYLVHSIGEPDYAAREAKAARAFAAAAEAAGVERVIYLGGVQPRGAGSTHLGARAQTGELLRAGNVPTFELRAGMIIGAGSASWQIVRRLAERLPAMLLPAWLRKHSWPVGVRDVALAILAALELTTDHAGCYDLPGPARFAHKELLVRTAALLGKRPPMLEVPLVSPALSSYWITAVTGVEHSLVRELIEGIRVDLDPSGPLFWDVIDHRPESLEDAIREALRDEIGGSARRMRALAS